MPKPDTVVFFTGAVLNCIEESKFYDEELASAEPLDKERVISLDQEIKATHEIFVSSIEFLPEAERSKLEHESKAIRKRLLKGMSARYTAIICSAQPSVAEVPLMETEGAQSLVRMEAFTELSGDLEGRELELLDSDNNEEKFPLTQKSLLRCPENYQPITFTNERPAQKRINPFSRDCRGYAQETRRTHEHPTRTRCRTKWEW